mmetsp:Transcript_11171/g.26470  ORF Transcript_11171/g.26470 Transcript_11171/m.26470 type:complete len:465 (-) Transcript_11171:76-1470(-)
MLFILHILVCFCIFTVAPRNYCSCVCSAFASSPPLLSSSVKQPTATNRQQFSKLSPRVGKNDQRSHHPIVRRHHHHHHHHHLPHRTLPQGDIANTVALLRAGNVDEEGDKNNSSSTVKSTISSIKQYVDKNFFLVGMLIAVLLAAVFPALGRDGGLLRPELFIGNYGVSLIFLLSGLSLQTSELTQAIGDVKLNGLINTLIFVVWPFCIGVPLRRLLQSLLVPFDFLPQALADGILIMTTLPTTVNMCIMLTSASGGNVAASICNAVLSNMAGIFITPLLLLQFFGASIKLPFAKMVMKLCQKVLLPVTVGQVLRTTKVKKLYQQNSKFFKRLQEVILLGIVWNAFCNAFSGEGLGLAVKHTLVLLALLPTLHLAALGVFFKLFSIPSLKFSRADIVAGMFCSSQKTLAFGLPLVNTIFQGDVNLAAYVAPIMFIHPLQMTIGSLLLPMIQRYTSGDTKAKEVS